MVDVYAKSGGVWRTATDVYGKDSTGTWRTASEVWGKDSGGVWRGEQGDEEGRTSRGRGVISASA